MRAHPRSRGDHDSTGHRRLSVEGSSPLARGPPYDWRVELEPVGLIPARAGTTMEASSSRTFTRAHPRSRGDHCRVIMSRMFIRGSSPLARGPPDVNQRIFDASGLIPARAGTTTSDCGCGRQLWAHPRSRGDHWRCGWWWGLRVGSSPLARGPRLLVQLLVRYIGLIPARAGNITFL